MKATFESDDPVETKRLSKAFDMALFILDIKNMMKSKTEVKCQDIEDSLYERGINLNDILE